MMVVVVACVVDQLASDVGSCVVHWVGHYFSPSIVEASALHYVEDHSNFGCLVVLVGVGQNFGLVVCKVVLYVLVGQNVVDQVVSGAL